MKRTLLPFCLILVAVPSLAQSTFQSFTPRYEADGTTYINAEIVRANADGSLTLRSESGDLELMAAAHAVPGLAGMRRGDKVLVAYDTVTDDNGRVRRIVTFARPASPTSGEPGPSFAVASGPAGRSVVRVIATSRRNRTITVTDASGTPMVLPVSSRTAASLDSFNPGDVVGLNFTNGGIISANALPSVNGIQALPVGTGVGPFVLPPVNGQLVGFDASTNRVTVQTPSGRQRTFPVGNMAGGGLSGLRPGDNLSLSFQATQAANRVRARAGGGTTITTVSQGGVGNTGSSVLSVGNVQSLGAGSFQTNGAFIPAGSPIGFNTASLNAQGLSNVSTGSGPNVAGVTAGGINAVGANAAGTAQGIAGIGNPGVGTLAGGNAGAANAGLVNSGARNFGVNTAANNVGANTGVNTTGSAGGVGTGVQGGGTFNPMVGGQPFTGGVAVASGIGASSPYTSTVPSIPSPTPVFNAVLPPAIAKAPLSNEDVGALRAYGERDLDAAALVLAAYANQVDAAWAGFLNGCLGGFTPESTAGRQWFLLLDDRVRTPTDDACRAQYTSLQGMATGWETQLNIAVDAARRADVLPGRVREILGRHRIDR